MTRKAKIKVIKIVATLISVLGLMGLVVPAFGIPVFMIGFLTFAGCRFAE